MDKLYRANFQSLPVSERETILKDLENTEPGFIFKRFERFERFGQVTDTAVYEFEHSEFVFVPGDSVTLGWDSFVVGMDDTTREELMENLQEYGITDLEEFLKENMSEVRKVNIGPMLVERKLNDIGWVKADFKTIEASENKRFKEAIKEMQAGECNQYIINDTLRLRKNNGEITADIYESVSYEDFVENIERLGFRLPTEDEWEYLCGGGSRTLFRWGDSFDYDMHLYHFEKVTPEKAEYDLEMPNQFGISIGYNPYKYEVLMDSNQFLKGGDGGCNICGGLGLALGYLPVSTYYRDINAFELDYEEDLDGDFTFYRRIIRL
ncbi:SUMF1/EgtB/PvdO family nonheme iron enzyme [Clostridium sp. SHJSY1]|uniref:SUMF1/EgtB/PvdO family nonheme iron enzyme n=1 Tax=Clostridium sp. SHJSY1 TaxID=2942483 RepID=UPI002875BEC3|nr:SUMF1/EgtB/PvdO family nonheme iron enzyme [Clostridium sp. SHJSY1]MDS0527417.1 SUMF1/EgtB/PvdO family nonheme iron enzyme [Clostridium sp. SHJSY1]